MSFGLLVRDNKQREDTALTFRTFLSAFVLFKRRNPDNDHQINYLHQGD